MRIAVTGANGFMGRNLVAHLRTQGGCEVSRITREARPRRKFGTPSWARISFSISRGSTGRGRKRNFSPETSASR